MKKLIQSSHHILTELEHLSVCFQRGLLLNPKDQRNYKRKQSGNIGELELITILIKYLPNNWKILRNVWLEIDGNRTEIDILVITPKFWWIIEVKNYIGHFEYRDQLCYLNQKQFPDQIAAYHNRIRIVKEIVDQMHGYVPEVCGTMVFINERCQVSVQSAQKINLIMRYQLLSHIDEMVRYYQQLSNTLPIKSSLDMIERYQIPNPFKPQVLDKSALEHITPGICCKACHSYDMEVAHRHVYCRKCQYSTCKQEAVLQAACDLGVLFYTDSTIITTNNLFNFTGGKISSNGLRKILRENIPKYGFKNTTYYKNYGLPYEKVKEIIGK